MSSFIEENYKRVCETPGDISEHLPTLRKYASECKTIAELGVCNMVSTYAFIKGLMENGNSEKVLHCVDIRLPPGVNNTINNAKKLGVDMSFYQENSAVVDLPPVDLCFIDTWHIYGHLKREFIKHAPNTKKYIILHDTEVDKVLGESIRCGFDVENQIRVSGYSREEICTGLQAAVDEFLEYNPEWRLKEHYSNNNGLTVLERV